MSATAPGAGKGSGRLTNRQLVLAAILCFLMWLSCVSAAWVAILNVHSTWGLQ